MLSEEEAEIRKLIEAAKVDIKADNLKEAGEKLHQAIQIAKTLGNEGLLNQIHEFVREFTYYVETQSRARARADGFILDIGGGGQGIIGNLNGNQVVAIDKNERELEETQNEALKVVMDATKLKFLPQSFDVCTSFFSIMYIPKNNHLKVFKEVHRVLNNGGRFLVWDANIPERFRGYKAFMVCLKVRLPDEEIEAGYGVEWQEQNIEYFRELANKTKFKTMNEWGEGGIFYLELSKE